MSTHGADRGAERALNSQIKRCVEEEQKAAARVDDLEKAIAKDEPFYGSFSILVHMEKLDLVKSRKAMAAATAERLAAEERKRKYRDGED